MGLFSKNRRPSLTAEEITARLQEMDSYFAAKDYKTCMAKAQQLEDEAPGHGAFFLGLCYNFGYGTDVDYNKALTYFQTATGVENEYTGLAYYRCGILYMSELFDPNNSVECHQNMLSNFENAEKHGTAVASMYLAYSHNLEALDFRLYAARNLKPSEITQANLLAVTHANQSIAKYIQVVNERPDDMDLFQWMRFGLNCLMLYKMACTGELSAGVILENSVKNVVTSSLRLVSSQMSGSDAQAVLGQNTAIFDLMDKSGRRMVAEYFRAYCALVDADDHHSAEAFYRARWHMKMFGELRSRDASAQDAVTLSSFMDDLTTLYDKMQKKYGNYVISFAQQGKLPDLSPSYMPACAPAVESCQSFMDMITELRGTPESAAPVQPQGKKKSTLAGFMLGGIRGYNKAKKENEKNGYN